MNYLRRLGYPWLGWRIELASYSAYFVIFWLLRLLGGQLNSDVVHDAWWVLGLSLTVLCGAVACFAVRLGLQLRFSPR